MAMFAMAVASGPLLDGYVTDVLMRDLVGHDRSPSAFLSPSKLKRSAAARFLAMPRSPSAPACPSARAKTLCGCSAAAD
jgi:hypothetical protein